MSIRKMRPISGRRVGFRPRPDYPSDFILVHGEERDRPRMLHAVRNRNVRGSLVVLADVAVDGECSGVCRTPDFLDTPEGATHAAMRCCAAW